MSRVANNPVQVPAGVEVNLNGQDLAVKGAKGELKLNVHTAVEVTQDEGGLKFAVRAEGRKSRALAGTTRALVQNMVTGVTDGFERRLELQGVGYRAQAQGKKLTMQLGLSHPVVYQLPDGIEAETPSQTEIVVTGIDKQQVGQICAELRSFRPPEPYKGKGVRYQGEYVRRKEAKKK